MKKSDIAAIVLWLSEQGYRGADEASLVQGFSERCNAIGIGISRSMVLIDTLHPDFEGRAFLWDADEDVEPIVTYEPTGQGRPRDSWEASIFYHLIEQGLDEVRREFWKGAPADFVLLDKIRDKGHTDCIAMIHRFTEQGRVGAMDALYSQWTTKKPEGFDDEDLATLRLLLPTLALAVKCASSVRIIGTLADVYLGHDAGQKVVSGQITRGAADKVDAVLWFSDLRNYTSISDSARPEEIIPLLNDYAELVIDAVHAHGGSVMKLVGDGILAVFRPEDIHAGCLAALAAEREMRGNLIALNERRRAERSPVTDVYLGLHIGKVFYGNIGSRDRLDFTVVGPAVNQVSRISGLCRSVDRDILMSRDFLEACPAEQRADLVSLGRFALRGVGKATELFTLDPERR